MIGRNLITIHRRSPFFVLLSRPLQLEGQLLALWGLFIVYFVEEARSLVRIQSWPTADWRAARKRGRGIRVISPNCGVGQSSGVEEVGSWKPDIVLPLESPKRPAGQSGLRERRQVLRYAHQLE